MKKTINLMALLLCVAAFAALSSCSKDNESDGGSTNSNTILGVEDIVGTWKCISSIDLVESYGNEYYENAYVGTIWKMESPYTHSDENHYGNKGDFIVQIGNETYDGSYVFEEGDEYGWPNCFEVRTNGNSNSIPFVFFTGWNYTIMGNVSSMYIKYTAKISGDIMTLYEYLHEERGPILKFQKQ